MGSCRWLVLGAVCAWGCVRTDVLRVQLRDPTAVTLIRHDPGGDAVVLPAGTGPMRAVAYHGAVGRPDMGYDLEAVRGPGGGITIGGLVLVNEGGALAPVGGTGGDAPPTALEDATVRGLDVARGWLSPRGVRVEVTLPVWNYDGVIDDSARYASYALLTPSANVLYARQRAHFPTWGSWTEVALGAAGVLLGAFVLAAPCQANDPHACAQTADDRAAMAATLFTFGAGGIALGAWQLASPTQDRWLGHVSP